MDFSLRVFRSLCIDPLIRAICDNTLIHSIRISDLHIPIAVANADDIAILTLRGNIQEVFDTYNSFSDVSGPYLNVL